MSNDKQTEFKRYYIILAILIAVALFLALTGSFKSGNRMEDSNKNIDSYKSVADLMDNTSIELDLPDFVIDASNVEIRSFMGMLVEIGTEDFVLKAANFVDINADPLGLYSEAENTEVFKSDNDIKYIKIRTGYPEYINCTLINWCTDKTAYGMMLSGVYDTDSVFKILNLNKSEYTKSETIITEVDDEDTNWITINNKFKISIPEISSSLELYDYDGYTIAYMDKTTCFIIVYNDLDINNKTFEFEKQTMIDDGVIIYYRNSNPFKSTDKAYVDYDKIIEALDNQSIKIDKN